MKALTLHQPWATLVVRGVKRFETRDWTYRPFHIASVSDHTPAHVTWAPSWPLRLAIHASRRFTPEQLAFTRWLRDVVGLDITEDLPTGAIVGTVTYQGFEWSYDEARRRILDEDFGGNLKALAIEMELGDWSEGRVLWRLDDPVELETPIEARGAQRIWNWLLPDFEPDRLPAAALAR